MTSNLSKVVSAALAAFVAVLFVSKLSKGDVTSNGSKYPTVTLSKKNTITFRDVFTGDSVANAQAKVLALSSALPKDEPIYLYLDTPGGSIVAGQQLIGTFKGLPHEIKTITSFAASMGFITSQSLGERLVLPNGIYMSHRAKVGIEGQIPGEFNSQSLFWANTVTEIEQQMANRMGLNLSDYQAKIRDEYWVAGEKAVADHASDKVVNVRCGEDMVGTYDEKIQTIFGAINVTWSECPLISNPVGVSFAGLDGMATDVLEIDRLKHVTFEALTNRRAFVNDPILQQSYNKYVK